MDERVDETGDVSEVKEAAYVPLVVGPHRGYRCGRSF